MHVIVGQGQLDAILMATPEERRGFIEEAAGVLKHRKRKEKAIRKLDSMQANLASRRSAWIVAAFFATSACLPSGRAPLGRAEVSLTIDNTDGALPIDYTEVTISRNLFNNTLNLT